MISDGFGDARAPIDYDQMLRDKRPLIEIQVSERTSDADLREDLIQEAMITAWEVARDHPEKAPAYLHAATRMRIVEVLTRGKFTGQPSQQGKPSVDPLRRTDRDSLDDPLLAVEAAAPEVLDAILMAYHQGQILHALEALSPQHREYVVLRFWGGWTSGELAPLLGVKSTNVARVWTEQIRPVLAEQLAHLGV